MSNDVLLLLSLDITHLFQINSLIILVVLIVNMTFFTQPGFPGYKGKNEKEDKLTDTPTYSL